MPKRFKGNDVTLYLEEAVSGSGLTVWGCCQQLQVTESTEFIEVTPINGRDTSFLPTYDSVTIDASGLYVLEEYNDTVLPTETLRNWRRNHTKLNYLIIVGDITDYSYDVYSGQCYISQAVGSFNVDEAAGISINLIGVGASSDYSPASGTVPPPFGLTCPTVVSSQTDDSINFAFIGNTQTTSIIWQLLLSGVEVDTATLTPPYAIPITGTITGLSSNTAYTFRVTLNNTAENYSLTCNTTITTDITSGGGVTSYPYLIGVGATENDACTDTNESPITVYSDSSTWQIGMELYTDDTLSTPLSTTYVVQVGIGTLYSMAGNVVDAATGNTCQI